MDKDEDENKRIVTFIVLVVIFTSFVMGIGADEGGGGEDTVIL